MSEAKPAKHVVNIRVNGRQHELMLEPQKLLLEVLREDLGLTGTKFGCELGECGVCTVLINDVPTLSCVTLAAVCDGKEIVTVEGLQGVEYDIVREAFVEEGAAQCGYCTPSMVLMLTHLLKTKGKVDIRKELSGNLCRCTGYVKIIKAYERSLEIAGQ